eukprot:9306981-Pyramimonas_sp.AAC.1
MRRAPRAQEPCGERREHKSGTRPSREPRGLDRLEPQTAALNVNNRNLLLWFPRMKGRVP